MFQRKRYDVRLPSGGTMVLGERTLVMGILNVTPDSFSDGGLLLEADRAVAAGLRMAADGADILDVGGESTRPGAEPVGAAEEMRRVLPVVERLAAQTAALISIDTYKAAVAREAMARGASIINDISGLQYDPDLGGVAAATSAPLILMHTRGTSQEMYSLAVYADVVREVCRELQAAVDRATAAGVSRESLILDPGFGFAKRADHSYSLLARLNDLSAIDRPILSGPSRKSFLKEALGERLPADREWGTAAAVAASVLLGAHIVRVHDVKAMVDVVRVADRIRAAARS
ncbi:MAG TPA: dihydropteroate synthase [Vicinamibacterales bacterium]|nr:dihydropteroate synthase [Vicinamibacterales bacterium]